MRLALLLLLAGPAAATVRLGGALPPAVQALPPGFGAPFSVELERLGGLVPQRPEGWPGFLAVLKEYSLGQAAPYRAAAAATVLDALERGDAELAPALAGARVRPAALIVLADGHRRFAEAAAAAPGLREELAAARRSAALAHAPGPPVLAAEEIPEGALAELRAAARALDRPPQAALVPAGRFAPVPASSYEAWRAGLEAYADPNPWQHPARSLAQAGRELRPEEALELVRGYMRLTVDLGGPRHLAEPRWRESGERVRKAAWELGKLFTQHGWGDRPHEAKAFGEFVALAAAKPAVAVKEHDWRALAGDEGRLGRSFWLLEAYRAPLGAIGSVLAARPELAAASPNTGFLLMRGLLDLQDAAEAHQRLSRRLRGRPEVEDAWQGLQRTLGELVAAVEALAKARPGTFAPPQPGNLRASLKALVELHGLDGAVRARAWDAMNRLDEAFPRPESQALVVRTSPGALEAPSRRLSSVMLPAEADPSTSGVEPGDDGPPRGFGLLLAGSVFVVLLLGNVPFVAAGAVAMALLAAGSLVRSAFEDPSRTAPPGATRALPPAPLPALPAPAEPEPKADPLLAEAEAEAEAALTQGADDSVDRRFQQMLDQALAEGRLDPELAAEYRSAPGEALPWPELRAQELGERLRSKGHALLGTAGWFSDEQKAALLEAFRDRAAQGLKSRETIFIKPGRGGTGKPEPWWHAHPALAPARETVERLAKVLAEALPEERLVLKLAELRYTHGSEPVGAHLGMHGDGGHLGVTMALEGTGTVYMEDGAARQAPAGDALLLTGSARETAHGIRRTRHAAPRTLEERLVLVVRFESRHLASLPANKLEQHEAAVAESWKDEGVRAALAQEAEERRPDAAAAARLLGALPPELPPLEHSFNLLELGELLQGQGVGVLETGPWLPLRYRRGLSELLKRRAAFGLHDYLTVYADPKGRLHDFVRPDMTRLPEPFFDLLIDYARSLTALLNAALSAQEQVELDVVQLRYTDGRLPHAFDVGLHEDGGYLAATVALAGEGTEYLDGEERHRAPEASALVFTAMDREFALGHRVRATRHAVPGTVSERLLAVLRFRPKRAVPSIDPVRRVPFDRP